MKKLSELSIADLYAISEICSLGIKDLSRKGDREAKEVLDAVVDEITDRIVEIHAQLNKEVK